LTVANKTLRLEEEEEEEEEDYKDAKT